MTGPPWDQRLARWLVRPLARTPIHPNYLTVASLAVGLAAAALFAEGDAAYANWGAVAFMTAAFMDHTDGELARMTGKTSRFGHYLDLACAAITYTALFVGIGLGLAQGAMGREAAVMGVVAGVSVATIFTARFYIEERFGGDIAHQPNFAGFEPEDVLYLIGPITWLGWLEPFLIAAAIGAPAFLLVVFWQIGRLILRHERDRP